jgi:hypothetical protein
MNALTICCNECGTPLEASDSVRYLTCGNCGTQLSVMRISSSIFTEKLEAIGNAEMVRIQNDIVQLDYLWELERQKYLVRLKRSFHEPSPFHYVFFGALTSFGFSFFLAAAVPPTSVFNILFSILFTSGCAVRLAECVKKGAALKSRRAAYEIRRSELQGELAVIL